MNTRKSVWTLAVGVLLLAASSVMSASPKVIAYQGRLTDLAGNPVVDGIYSVDFRLYPTAVGGFLLWSEPGVLVTTVNGLFTTNLGSPTAFPSGFYDFYSGPEDIFLHAPELWLEIQVGASILSPRTQMLSVPHAISASNLGGRAAWDPDAGIETSSDAGMIENFGADGVNRFLLWGNNYGELLLYDFAATQGVRLSTNGAGGSSLTLGDGFGGAGVHLHGGLTGNNSVLLPSDAVSAAEILNEPGIAIGKRVSGLGLVPSSTSQDFVTVSITIPSAGYIVLDGYTYLYHNNGPTSFGWSQISETSTAAFAAGPYVWTGSTYTGNTTGYNYENVPVKHTVFKGSPGAYTFYLQGNAYIANSVAASVSILSPTWLQATFFPTSYGAVASLASAPPTDNPDFEAVTITDPLTKETTTKYSVDLRYYELQAQKDATQALKSQLALEKARTAAMPAGGAPNATSAVSPKQK